MRNKKKKIIRAATVPMSLSTFLEGSIETLMERYELVRFHGVLEGFRRFQGVSGGSKGFQAVPKF